MQALLWPGGSVILSHAVVAGERRSEILVQISERCCARFSQLENPLSNIVAPLLLDSITQQVGIFLCLFDQIEPYKPLVDVVALSAHVLCSLHHVHRATDRRRCGEEVQLWDRTSQDNASHRRSDSEDFSPICLAKLIVDV